VLEQYDWYSNFFLQKMTLGGGQHRPVSKITLAAKAALTKRPSLS